MALSSTDVCPFCGGGELIYECRFPDSKSKPVQIHSCRDCGCFIPSYKAQSYSLDKQTELHEDLWILDSRQDWESAKLGMIDLVNKQSWVLGTPSPRNLILDIGSGRGNLTAALDFHGYNYMSCEPSKALRRKAIANYGLSEQRLLNMTADDFLKYIAKSKIDDVDDVTIYFWHVLEHIKDSLDILQLAVTLFSAKKLNILIQMPMLKSSYIFSEHYYLATPDWFNFISEVSKLKLVHFSWSRKNLFMTGFLSNNNTFDTADLKRPFRSMTQFERHTYLITPK